ncbi:hypothetical protein J1605_022728 [Eschrichtius robustus]|uniref:Uncharacterized protein n=1 Tax=Eschrichtius robustus TaxID=9764 RepID=A0AB34H4I9_ESCRO|nr:hypothetical protein J1605_022728 [Eschrichtius robustus]
MRALNSLEARVSWMQLAGAWRFSGASVRIVLGERSLPEAPRWVAEEVGRGQGAEIGRWASEPAHQQRSPGPGVSSASGSCAVVRCTAPQGSSFREGLPLVAWPALPGLRKRQQLRRGPGPPAEKELTGRGER